MADSAKKRLLNAGSGLPSSARLREFFPASDYIEVRLDIDPSVRPDLLGSVCDMRNHALDGSYDAVWSSHSLEHLHEHEARAALAEFRRVLRPHGFAIVTCPDVAAAARLLETHDIEDVVYQSSAGPIRILDILYGHSASIAQGHVHMAHRTGFTATRLGRLAAEAGFAETRLMESDGFDLWAVLTMPEARLPALAKRLAKTPIAALFALSDSDRHEDQIQKLSGSHVRRQFNPAPAPIQGDIARAMASSLRPSGSP